MRKRFWVMAALAASCAPALPSTVPLGRGPLAASTVEEPEPRVAAKPVGDAAADSNEDADAGTTKATDAAPEAADGGSAEPDAEGADAGQEAATSAQNKTVFAGHYSGNDVTTVHMGNLPSPPQKDPNAIMDVADPGGGTLEFSLLDSRTSKLICKLEGTLSGNTAQLTSGQHCFDKESAGAGSATLDSGTASFNGKQLVFDMHLDLQVQAGGQTMTGDIDYHFEGTRQ